MKKLAVLVSLALFAACLSVAHSQSLADLAKKEKERRAEVKDGKVITDEEAAKFRTSREEIVPPEASQPESPAGAADSAEAEGQTEKTPKAGRPDPDEPTDFKGRTESFWRKTMTEARQKIKDLTNESNVIQLKIAELQNKFYSMDDGFNRETVQRELQKTYYQQDLNKENLKNAEDALQDLENEARKSGALPGWIQ